MRRVREKGRNRIRKNREREKRENVRKIKRGEKRESICSGMRRKVEEE